MRVAIVGSGYVGLVAGACFADMGHQVVLVDNDQQKLAALKDGQVPIHEKFLPELLERHRGRSLTFSDDLRTAVEASGAVFIAVGTPPTEQGHADLSYVESVARIIPSAINGYKVVVEKSTVPVYTSEWIRKIILRNAAAPDSFDVASNPEFLREGTAVTDFLYPDRIVIGADDENSVDTLQAIYEPLTSGRYYRSADRIAFGGYQHSQAPIIVTNAKSAELIKHASNAFLAMKISFINAVANISEAVGADIEQVCAGIGSDSRIGERFLNAGIGYGGSCFPKDVRAFHAVATQCGYDFGLLTEVMRINIGQRRRFLKKVRSALWTLRGKRLAVLGLAFKGDTDDIRESPAIEIIETLLREGSTVRVYDPAAAEKALRVLPTTGVVFTADPYEAAADSDALLILTEWPEFANLDLTRIRTLLKYPIVIDGRNLYEPQQMTDAGIIYHSIGRGVGIPQDMSSVVHGSDREAMLHDSFAI